MMDSATQFSCALFIVFDQVKMAWRARSLRDFDDLHEPYLGCQGLQPAIKKSKL
jgi:hypothetical protein